MSRDIKIFSGKNSKNLAERICKEYDGGSLNDLKLQRFADNEFIVRVAENCRGCDVFVIQACHSSAESIWESLMLSDSLKRASANKIIGVFAYLPYSRSDKKAAPREPITAKLLADVLQTAGYNRIVTIDLHNDSIQGFFNVPVDHLSANYVFIPYIKSLNLENIVFGTPDVGGSKRAKKFSDTFETDLIICNKHRPSPNVISEMKIIGDVKDKNVILVDDLIDTAGTLCKASDLIMANGAKSVRALVTHPVLSGEAYQNIEKSKILEVITTDTIPLKQTSDKIKVISVDKLLASAIHRINNNESISTLFV
jgi:ribose-phosphate pyrophosphokinase